MVVLLFSTELLGERFEDLQSRVTGKILPAMIIVKDVTKRYARAAAVDQISFSVAKGQIVGFLGPNGAGKTTTMRILTCFLSALRGTASIAGFDVLEQPFEVKKRIGYLPETPPLYPEMETAEYLRSWAS